MKKFFTLFAAAALTAGMSAQTRIMYVNDGSGNITKHVINNNTKITFGTETPQEYTDIVDLGLSVKWASCNLGSTTPEGFGNFYAWAETSPKETFTLENYEHYDPFEQDTNGYWAFKEITGTSHDAATVNLGDLWRMPTQKEWKELVEECTWQFTTRNGVEGYEITGKNGNRIFLPGAGNKWDGNGGEGHTHIGGGFYWTSTCAELTDLTYFIYRGNFTNQDITFDGYDFPETGMTIRPVYGPIPGDDIEPVPDAQEAVDLGLSVKWSPINLGATAPGDFGNFYPWACLTSPDFIDDSTYPYFDWRTETWADIPDFAGNAKYDAAAAFWSNGWRTPTLAEFDELLENCDYVYEYQNGHDGYKFTSRINGNSIFLPLGGRVGVDGWGYTEQIRNVGYYWSSTPDERVPDFAWYLRLSEITTSSDMTKPARTDNFYKSTGYNIRPVKK